MKRGLFEYKDTATISALAFVRRFRNLSTVSPVAGIYTNLLEDDNTVDESKLQRRENLIQRLKYNLYDEANLRCYNLTWNGKGVEGQGEGCYISILLFNRLFCITKFCADICMLIEYM